MTRRVTVSPYVDRFRGIADDFCRLIDERDIYSAPELLQRAQRLLASLVEAAPQLPEIERGGPTDSDGGVSDVWQVLFASLGSQLAEYDYFWEIYDPYKADEPIRGSLADAFADLYVEFKSGLTIWETADASRRREIVWEWRFGFEVHWGHQAIDAMRAIHSLLFVHHIGDPDRAWPPEPNT